MSVRAEPDAAAGRAVIRVAGAAGAAASPGFRILREDWDDNALGPQGWQSSDALLQPDTAAASGPDLVLQVGWAVCQHLEAGMYTFALPAGGIEAATLSWPDITPLHAGALDVLNQATASAPVPLPASPPTPGPAAPPVPPPPSPKPVPAAQPVAPTPADVPPDRNLAPLYVLLALLLLLAAGAGGWWVFGRPRPVIEAQTTPPTAAPSPPAPPTPPAADPAPTLPTPPNPPPAPAAPLLGSLSVPDVLTKAPNPAAIAAEGTRRLQGDRHDDGLLLLEAAADRGDGAAAAALGALYDPVRFHAGGPIPQPDPRQAARYYRDAARTGADVAAARDALKHSLETKASSGDLGANLTLKDFWP